MDLRMPDLNLILMAGNLTNDPRYSETKTGTPVVNFYMASNKRFKDRSGTIKEDVCFVGVVAWDNLAVSCRDNLTRGSSVLVTGELQSRKIYSDEGAPRNMVEIKAKKIQFLDVRRAEVADPQAVDALADVGNALPEN
ncbi:MAG: single-stranded DNA-binding protein [Candidatus Marinimicrobia bacterium]|nr:single-stranded DNA-binding protein [Candidatus Neomarinimicrobiota bacterium]